MPFIAKAGLKAALGVSIGEAGRKGGREGGREVARGRGDVFSLMLTRHHKG